MLLFSMVPTLWISEGKKERRRQMSYRTGCICVVGRCHWPHSFELVLVDIMALIE